MSVMLRVVVPQGVRPGQTIQIATPDGRRVNVQVPPSCGPGSSFQVKVLAVNNGAQNQALLRKQQEALRLRQQQQALRQQQQRQQQQQQQQQNGAGVARVTLTVPPNVPAGSKLRVMFNGHAFNVPVPSNVPPGGAFIALLPTGLADERSKIEEERRKLAKMQKQIADQRSAAANTMSFINEEQKRADEARMVFQKYDVDHSNSIDRTELTNLLCDLGFPPEVIDVELATADSDGNNFVEWPEFVIYYNNLRERMKNGAVESAKKAVEARRSQHSELEELQKLQAALASQQAALEKRESEIAAKEAQIKSSSLLGRRVIRCPCRSESGRNSSWP